jgi:hypothetical protein
VAILRVNNGFLIIILVLGAMSKALATIATQPLIVAKVGLQSRPPPSRNGKPFKTFGEVMKHIVDNEGLFSLFKGIGPQILKGLLVQGLLMMTKERYVSVSKLPSGCTNFWEGWSSFSSSCSPTSRTSRRINCARQWMLQLKRPRPACLLP